MTNLATGSTQKCGPRVSEGSWPRHLTPSRRVHVCLWSKHLAPSPGGVVINQKEKYNSSISISIRTHMSPIRLLLLRPRILSIFAVRAVNLSCASSI